MSCQVSTCGECVSVTIPGSVSAPCAWCWSIDDPPPSNLANASTQGTCLPGYSKEAYDCYMSKHISYGECDSIVIPSSNATTSTLSFSQPILDFSTSCVVLIYCVFLFLFITCIYQKKLRIQTGSLYHLYRTGKIHTINHTAQTKIRADSDAHARNTAQLPSSHTLLTDDMEENHVPSSNLNEAIAHHQDDDFSDSSMSDNQYMVTSDTLVESEHRFIPCISSYLFQRKVSTLILHRHMPKVSLFVLVLQLFFLLLAFGLDIWSIYPNFLPNDIALVLGLLGLRLTNGNDVGIEQDYKCSHTEQKGACRTVIASSFGVLGLGILSGILTLCCIVICITRFFITSYKIRHTPWLLNGWLAQVQILLLLSNLFCLPLWALGAHLSMHEFLSDKLQLGASWYLCWVTSFFTLLNVFLWRYYVTLLPPTLSSIYPHGTTQQQNHNYQHYLKQQQQQQQQQHRHFPSSFPSRAEDTVNGAEIELEDTARLVAASHGPLNAMLLPTPVTTGYDEEVVHPAMSTHLTTAHDHRVNASDPEVMSLAPSSTSTTLYQNSKGGSGKSYIQLES